MTCEDHIEVVQLIARYARGVDYGDVDLLASTLAANVHKKGTSIGEMGAIFARDPRYTGETPLGGRDFAESIVNNMAHIGSQHVMTNHLTAFDGDTATVQCYLIARHFRKDDPSGPAFEVGGEYTHDLVRTVDGWKISFWRLDITWEQGDVRIMVPTA
ncbi:MAG: nuclear transport factor 2 family protein [Mycetocola sp.]